MYYSVYDPTRRVYVLPRRHPSFSFTTGVLMYQIHAGYIMPEDATQTTLDFSRLSLTILPTMQDVSWNITAIDLSYNSLTMLPYALPRAASLKRLLLRVNPLTALPECIRECHNLEELYVSGCPLTMLPDWLDELTALRILEISDTAIPDCPSVLRRLPNLRMLGIANLPWTTLPPWFCDLPLTTLTIDGMPRCDCSPLVGLKQLQHLGLSAMDYTIVPEWIRQLPLLHLLDLSHNPLEILPSWLETIPITTLMLAHVPLAALPDWHTWDRLTTLDLTACHLADAAFRMPLPRNLTHLNLDQNPITQLPSELYQCHSLYACSLANTALTTLPAWFLKIFHLYHSIFQAPASRFRRSPSDRCWNHSSLAWGKRPLGHTFSHTCRHYACLIFLIRGCSLKVHLWVTRSFRSLRHFVDHAIKTVFL